MWVLGAPGSSLDSHTDGLKPPFREEVLVTAEVSASKRDSGPGGVLVMLVMSFLSVNFS